jgi:hypothetical protein
MLLHFKKGAYFCVNMRSMPQVGNKSVVAVQVGGGRRCYRGMEQGFGGAVGCHTMLTMITIDRTFD